MGEFLSLSAVRDRSVDQVVAAICADAASRGVSAGLTREPPDEDTDATVASRGSWTLIFWLDSWVGETEAFGTDLSRSLGTLVSTVEVYDGDIWYHFLSRDGELLDSYSSDPGYFTSDPEEKERMRREWQSNPEVIAAQIGVPVQTIRPYLVDWELLPPLPRKGVVHRALRWLGWTSQVDPDEMGPKAFPEDEARLGDVWVFADFWRRLGISYDGGPGERKRRVRFSTGFGTPPVTDSSAEQTGGQTR